LTIKLRLGTVAQVEHDALLSKAGLLPETKVEEAHNGRISLYATLGIGKKQFSLNAPASRLKKSCRGVKSEFLIHLRQ